ncbi:capping complex subunit for YIEGIA [Desulfitibacter alkalitolerans]|uniref:capping complex subunit for YIEGIA n=1 Tax=Desulfitibacter alkalitolerans TaxID=264641 RepID=UPI00048034A5|nr:hypothetical protein [Desulfitibacter alkalitolerans]
MDAGVLIAIVTTNLDLVRGGGAPVFLARDEEELERLSLLMSRIFKAMVHDLENGVYLLYRQ